MLKGLSHLSKILSLAGLALMLVAYFWYLYIDLMIADFTFTTATVVDREYSVMSSADTVRPVVHFLDNEGALFELVVDDATIARQLAEGDTPELMYLTAFPGSAVVYSRMVLWGGPVILFLIGLLMLIPQLSITLKNRLKYHRIKAGTPLDTQFVNVEKNRGAEVDGVLPFCIYSQWRDPDTAEIHFFKSKDLWVDPSEYIRKKRITVFVKQNDLSHYDVDLSFLPEHIVHEHHTSF